MAHQHIHHDGPEDYRAAFAELPEVLQSAAIGAVRAAQSLSDEQAVDVRDRLGTLVQPEGSFTGAAARFVAAAAMVVEAHHDKIRADNP